MTKGIDSLAVLPFSNASNDPDMEDLSDGDNCEHHEWPFKPSAIESDGR